ncbi:unnamed protein product [Diplocarpon coronariae]|nr:hypothetical protein JHW43_006347 [Diplocarpon mali]
MSFPSLLCADAEINAKVSRSRSEVLSFSDQVVVVPYALLLIYHLALDTAGSFDVKGQINDYLFTKGVEGPWVSTKSKTATATQRELPPAIASVSHTIAVPSSVARRSATGCCSHLSPWVRSSDTVPVPVPVPVPVRVQ